VGNNDFMMNPVKSNNTWRMLLVITALVLLGGVLFAWSRILFPVMIAFLLAYLTHPLATYCERRRLPRVLGFLIVLFVLLGLLALVFFVFLPAFIHELMLVAKKFPIWKEAVQNYANTLLAELEQRFPDAYALLQERITAWAQENFPLIAQRLVAWLLGMITSLVGFASLLLNIILIPVIAAYLTVDYHKFTSALRVLVPRPVLPTVRRIVLDVDQVLWNFLRGQLLVAFALGIMYTAGLLISRVPLAMVIGPLAGLLSLVPYMGFILGIGSASLFVLLEFQGAWQFAGVAITFAAAHAIEGWVLTPKMVGDRVGLHPVWVLIALLLGGELFGLSGVVVAVPVAAALRVILRYAFRAYRESSLYLGGNLAILFYTREGCPLCDEFEALLQAFLNCRGLHYQRIDVDQNPAVKERFGKRIPVLEINGELAAEGRTTPAALKECIEVFLKKIF
jgi:predicted PurR-regulated permease PerM